MGIFLDSRLRMSGMTGRAGVGLAVGPRLTRPERGMSGHFKGREFRPCRVTEAANVYGG